MHVFYGFLAGLVLGGISMFFVGGKWEKSAIALANNAVMKGRTILKVGETTVAKVQNDIGQAGH